MTTLMVQKCNVFRCLLKTKQNSIVQFFLGTNVPRGIRTELVSQQEKLTNNLKQERGQLYWEEISRLQFFLGTNVPRGTRTELVSQQEKLTNNLKQERGQVYWEEISRLQCVLGTNVPWGIRTELKYQQEKLTNSLKQEREQVYWEERSRLQCILWGIRPELESQQEKLTNSLKLERRKVSREERSRIQTGPLPRTAEIKDAICLLNKSGKQTYRRAENFQSSKIITKYGGVLEITETGVSLLVPPGALLEDCKIHIQIITGNLDTGDDVTFASNAAAIVELTPDNFEFQTAVELQLPHCLQLKENFTKESVEVFTSHHDPKDPPRWERETDVKFELQKETCKLYLKKFCWVTLRVNNKIVEAKRLKIFTVGDKVMDTDNETTVHVGYFPDVPGNEDIFIDENITVGQYKPFWFKKEESTPLGILLKYITPNEWTNTADGSLKEISYEDIASSKNRSCVFVFRCNTSVRRSGVPYVTFSVFRQHDSTSISFRPKIWDEVSEDEES